MGIGSGSGAQGNIPGVEPGSGSGFTGGTRSGSEPGWGSGSGEGPGPGFGIGGVDVVLGEPMYMSCSNILRCGTGLEGCHAVTMQFAAAFTTLLYSLRSGGRAESLLRRYSVYRSRIGILQCY